MAEVNKRINELPPNSALQDDCLLAVYNPLTDKTERVPVGQFIPASSANFEWLSAPEEYFTGDVVTYQGKWYQAVDDSVGVIPGTDEDFWVEISKSPSGFVFWQAGAYVEDSVFVMSAHNGQLQLFTLASATRPYVSTDIAAEEELGDWVSITEVLQNQSVDMSVASPILNFKRHRDKRFYGSASISTPKTPVLDQELNAKNFELVLNITNVAATLGWPAGFISNSALWNDSTRVITFLVAGKYKIKGSFDGTNWWLEVAGEIYL